MGWEERNDENRNHAKSWRGVRYHLQLSGQTTRKNSGDPGRTAEAVCLEAVEIRSAAATAMADPPPRRSIKSKRLHAPAANSLAGQFSALPGEIAPQN